MFGAAASEPPVIFLEEGDSPESGAIHPSHRQGRHTVEAAVRESELPPDAGREGQYRHYMLKEIHEHRAPLPTRCKSAAEGRLLDGVRRPPPMV